MKKLLLPIFIIGTLIMMVVMARTGSTLKTAVTPLGIVDLEFACNTKRVNTVLSAWAPTPDLNNLEVAKLNTWWDFVFLFFYSGCLFLACKKLNALDPGRVPATGNIIARAAIAAGILDVLENIGMLISLEGYISNWIAYGTCFVSIMKWILALVVVLFVIAALARLAYKKIKWKH